MSFDFQNAMNIKEQSPMDWLRLYTSAMLERDPAKLGPKLASAKEAVHRELRAESAKGDASDRETRKALQEAFENLNAISATWTSDDVA